MKELLNGKRLLIISLIISLYFLSLFLINYFKVEHVMIGFFIELLSIPFLLAQIIFLIVGISRLFSKTEDQKLIMFSVVILAISSIITFGSFFFNI